MTSLDIARVRRRGVPAVVAVALAAALSVGDTSPAFADTPAPPMPVDPMAPAATDPAPAPSFSRVEESGFLRTRRGHIRDIAAPRAEGVVTVNGVDFSGTAASGTNDRGQVVGSYAAGGTSHGFVLDDGEYRTIDVPRAASTAVLDINNRGEMVGSYTDRHGRGHGFVRSRRGRITTIAVPGAFVTGPHRINDRGQVAGVYSDVDNTGAPVRTGHGFVWDDGRFTTFDAPGGGPLTDPAGIDDRGVVVGAYDDADGVTHGFLRTRRGRVVTLDIPGAAFTSLLSINDEGDIVGQYANATDLVAGRAHGVLLRRGETDPDATTTFDVPDFPITVGADLDDRGRIVGFAYRVT